MLERFRTLPMWRSAVLVGRSLADLLTALLCALIVALTGLAVGWRPEANIASVIGGFALMLFFAYAVSWVSACMGLNAKSPETAAPDRSRAHLVGRDPGRRSAGRGPLLHAEDDGVVMGRRRELGC